MEIISEKELTPKQAIHFLKKITKESFIEENDPELAKNLGLVLTEISAHQDDIVVPEKTEEEEVKEEEKAAEEVNEEKKEEEKVEEKTEDTEVKHKKHRKHRKEQNE